MRLKIKTRSGEKFQAYIIERENSIEVKVGDETIKFSFIRTPYNDFIVQDENGEKYRITPIFLSKFERVFEVDGKAFVTEIATEDESEDSEDIAIIKSSFSASIRKVYVSKGAHVKKGDLILDVESMKMINSIKSPIDGIVKEVYVSEGKSVSAGEKLVVIEKEIKSV